MLTKTRVDDDPHIERDLLAVSRYIERELGRRFNQIVGATLALVNNGSGITAAATSIAYDGAAGLPTVGAVRIGDELVAYAGGGGAASGTITGCVRGSYGTPAAAHADNDAMLSTVLVRYFDGPDSDLLRVDDLTNLVAIAVDLGNDNTYETIVAATDLYLRPPNAAQDGWPYTHLLLRPGNSAMTTWGRLAQSVKVTGTWGWPAVPAAIKSGVIHLTGILRLESPRATERIPEGIDQAISTSREGQKIVRDLMNVYGRVKVLV